MSAGIGRYYSRGEKWHLNDIAQQPYVITDKHTNQSVSLNVERPVLLHLAPKEWLLSLRTCIHRCQFHVVPFMDSESQCALGQS